MESHIWRNISKNWRVHKEINQNNDSEKRALFLSLNSVEYFPLNNSLHSYNIFFSAVFESFTYV